MRRQTVMVAVASAALVGAAFWWTFRDAPHDSPQDQGPASAAGAAQSAAPASRPGSQSGAPAAGSASAAATATAAPPAQPRPARVMPYRPAKYLLYSEDNVFRHGESDFEQPVFKKIVELTKPDQRQESLLRAFWKIHEDQRRTLWAEAFPRVSGPRILDNAKLEDADLAFESSVFGVLRPEQQQDLRDEVPPPGTPHTPPVEAYADPRLVMDK